MGCELGLVCVCDVCWKGLYDLVVINHMMLAIELLAGIGGDCWNNVV